MIWQKVAKEVAHIVNLEVGGKLAAKVGNVINAIDFFNPIIYRYIYR